MGEPYVGGCACGALRYRAEGEPLASSHCQCRDCKRTSGTGHGSFLVFPKSAVAHEGAPATWSKIADSGRPKTRAFCPACGSPVYLTVEVAPDIVAIHAASLDDPRRFAPTFVTYAGSALAWDHCDAALMKFDRMPPA
jgi:hypothetical protein